MCFIVTILTAAVAFFLCAEAGAATYYVGPAATGDGSGSSRSNLRVLATDVGGKATVQTCSPGDLLLLQPGDYGTVYFDRGYGTPGNRVEYRADTGAPGYVARADDWYEQTISRPTTSTAPVFAKLYFTADWIGATAKAENRCLDINGVTVIADANGVNTACVQFNWAVSGVHIHNSNIFGMVETNHATAAFDSPYVQDRTDFAVWVQPDTSEPVQTDYNDLLIDSCYLSHCWYGLECNPTGALGAGIEILDSHIYDCANMAISYRNNTGSNPLLVVGNHCHHQTQMPDNGTNRLETTVAVGTSPTVLSIVGSPASNQQYGLTVFHGGEHSFRWGTFAAATKTFTATVAYPWTPSPADVVYCHDVAHGAAIAVWGDYITVQKNRVHDWGNTGAFWIYHEDATGTTNITFEDNLFYCPWGQYNVGFGESTHDRRLGNYAVIRNNTIVGRRMSQYVDGHNPRFKYGIALQIYPATGIDAGTVVIANNLLVGTASGFAEGTGAVVRNNIIWNGSTYDTDAAGDNQGNIVYCPSSEVYPGSTEFDTTMFQGNADTWATYAWGTPVTTGSYGRYSGNLNGCWQLLSTAPAVGAAYAAHATTTDIAGTARSSPDVGAYEYAGAVVPAPASEPDPADAATGVELTPILTWGGGAGATSFDVYFGTDSTPDLTEFIGSQATMTYTPAALTASTTYYWKVIPENATGHTADGDVTTWSFTTTADATIPTQATAPSPADGATSVSRAATTLSWTTGADAANHKVYFGTDSSPDSTEYKNTQTGTTYRPGMLQWNTTYYWRIDEVAADGVTITPGTVWSFTTNPKPRKSLISLILAFFFGGHE